MQNNFDEKVFYNPGDIVKLRHSKLENVPVMYVIEKVTKFLIDKEKGNTEPTFIGIKCRWFDKNSCLQEAVFSTKDLIHI